MISCLSGNHLTHLNILTPSSTEPFSGSSFATAIILAAGSGSRMQSRVKDKLLAPLNGLPVVCHSIRAFITSGCVQQFTIVYRDEKQKAALQESLKSIDLKQLPITWTKGGDRRQDSVHQALLSQSKSCSHVFIHDGARPLVSSDSLRRLHKTVLKDDSATLAHPVIDTIKRIPETRELAKATLNDLDRSRLWAVETPQAFDLKLILKAYEYVNETGLQITDDTAAISAIGLGTTLVPNDTTNLKITRPEDLDYAEWKLRSCTGS